MKRKISNTSYACVNLMYFMSNFPANFISECWVDKPNIIEHLKDKFKTYSEKYRTASQGFPSFFYDLDRENQTKLVNWINENYFAFTEFVDVTDTLTPIETLANNISEILEIQSKKHSIDSDNLSIAIDKFASTIDIISLESNGYDGTNAECIESISFKKI
jgi:hypothetical protein